MKCGQWMVFLGSVLSACGGAGAKRAAPAEPAAPKVSEDAARAVRGALEQYRQAYEVRSLAGLEPIYSRSLDVVLIEDGRAHRGFSAVVSHLERMLGSATEVHVELKDVAVVPLGDEGALATAEMKRSVSDGVTTVEVRGLLTLVFRRETRQEGSEPRWAVVHEHFSLTRPSP